jgi:hypothetical protein
VIVSDQTSERSPTYYNSKTQSFEVRDPALIYPEYLMFARPTPKKTLTFQDPTLDYFSALDHEIQNS